MSEEQLGQSQQQSEQEKTTASEQPAAGQEKPETSESSTSGDGDELRYEDNWRAYLANGDEKTLSELSRIKTDRDLAKEYIRQKAELSKRAANGAFPAEGSEEEQSAWREANGIPADPSLESYGVEVPQDYDLSKSEGELINDYLAHAAENNLPPSVVQASLDYWFRANAAGNHEMNEASNRLHDEWDAQVKQELGRDYEKTLEAANVYIEQAIEDETQRKEILNAQLPSGGLLSKHPAFIRMASDLAMQNGFGDQLHAEALEAGGKSIMDQINEIEALQYKDRKAYDAKQGKLLELYKAADKKGMQL